MKKILSILIVMIALFLAVATAAEVTPEPTPTATVDLTGIVLALIELTLAFLTCKVWPWIKSKTTETQQKTLINAAEVAVFAAEKVIGNGRGIEKLDRVRDHLREKGYNVNSKEVGDAIEAAVQKLPGNFLIGNNIEVEGFEVSDDTKDEDPDDEDTNPQ